MSSAEKIEPFPPLSPVDSDASNSPTDVQTAPNNGNLPRVMASTAVDSRPSRGRSLVQSFVTSNPPLGMWQATGEVGSKIPTLPEIRDGSFGDDGWSPEGQMERRRGNPHDIHQRTSRARRSSASTRLVKTVTNRSTGTGPSKRHEVVREEGVSEATTLNSQPEAKLQAALSEPIAKDNKTIETMDISYPVEGPDGTGTYPNGYRFPKKHTWSQSIVIALKAFWKFFLTPIGFLVIVYALNVVGWGAMIFFLLLEAAPAMCHPSCNDEYSPRRIWIEIDAQVLTALFCVTAFGLIPWRFRDFYYLARWRMGGEQAYHRRLAGIYRSWYRLPDSNKLADDIAPPPVYNEKNSYKEADPPAFTGADLKALEDNPALPLPPTSIPDLPLTGIRATPTKSWNLDVVIWMYMLNTWIQAPLCGIMWGMNRFNRPSWATGFLIAIGCISGIVAGIVVFIEGSKVKKVEGVPVKEYDVPESIEDYQKRKVKEDAKEAKKQERHVRSPGSHIRHTGKVEVP